MSVMANFTEVYTLHGLHLSSLSYPWKCSLPAWTWDRVFSSATESKFLKAFQFNFDICCYNFNPRHAKGGLCKTNMEEWQAGLNFKQLHLGTNLWLEKDPKRLYFSNSPD